MKLKTMTTTFVLCTLILPALAVGKSKAKKLDVREVAYLTCGEAWERSGKSDDKIIAMVKSMANYSLTKRQLTFPDTAEDGAAVASMIKERCSTNPDESLLSIVDRSIRDHLRKPG